MTTTLARPRSAVVAVGRPTAALPVSQMSSASAQMSPGCAAEDHQPDASSAETSEVGNRNTIAGTRYRNTQARPYTAMVGAERRLATEAVVIIGRVTHVSVGLPVLVAVAFAAWPCGRSSGTGTSMALKWASGSRGPIPPDSSVLP
ncbi:hypothetical protein AB0C90_04550 [Streptomyces sp. NPDC048550]|uniref:hypothetical protein n=1 Tax=Streptomyces sp. NPDC048550 TaxID=3155739 RepID=UPI00344A1D06